MEFVCKDPSGDDWYYLAEKYIRMKGNEVRSRISGKYLPDPISLWEGRAKKAGTILTPELRPTDATFALFKHWRELNADHNN